MSCVPARYNLLPRLRGDTWPGVIFTVEVNTSPEDFTDAVIEMGFRKRGKRGDDLDLLLSSTNSDITVVGNIITVVPRVLALYPGDYNYDLQVTYADGKIRTLVGGSISIKADTTP